jgi:methionyl-tRNA synthetase
LKETVKFGDEVRTIVSGIAKHYKPEEMVGKKVVFVTNLAPRKICGIMSEGMIMGAEDANGNFSLIVPEKDIESGATLG